MEWLQQKDLKYIWHPCSQMKDYEDFPPIVIDRGEGAYLYDVNGKSYLDAVSSWWVNLFGHSNKRINRAIQKQLEKLEHVIFANFSHRPAIELAERMVEITPKGLSKVFFADNGSAAVEVALKLSFQYHQQKGKTKKTKFVAITDAYHGETLGALSVGDLDLYSKIYKPVMLNTYKAKGPDCYRCSYDKCRENCNAECFHHMESLINEKHQEICAVIIEPLIQGAAGMKMYPPVYLKKLKALCKQYDIHFIADEIAVGFGRTGKMFACEHANVSPDIMCLSKGITAGYMPLSLVLVTDEIYDAFYSDYTELKAFMHSHSYTGNTMACAVACEVLNIFEQENILEDNRQKSKLLNDMIKAAADDHPYIGEFRQLGMVGALELVEDKKSKKGFEWQKRVGYNIYKIALEKGVLLRPLGNVIYFMPPYIVEEKDIALMVNAAFESINEYFGI
ncbi:MAG: adenosylmethionine---8-amino-7-oxononanoate aminotransferase [Clostridiales bacterium]|jgi:adenosylmethionine-8-amino-7-oxononanoate aminotransferase|nr:adenosylmethionine---8-amino-7-oxononanoate aminotransferase [Clostridiales bacterium]MDK2933800.1 adenosylmethionine---8-amino-7-oxononanoate aminotransferase [Clostridiales bacterium]